MRVRILGALLALSATAVTIGASLIATPAGWVTGGVLLAGWAWLVVGE